MMQKWKQPKTEYEGIHGTCGARIDRLQSKLTRAIEGLKELERSTEYEAKLAESAEDDKRHVLLFRGLMLHARKTREDVEGMK